MCLRVLSLPGTLSRKSLEPSGINTGIAIGGLRFSVTISTLYPEERDQDHRVQPVDTPVYQAQQQEAHPATQAHQEDTAALME
jgi:hypothetical protein